MIRVPIYRVKIIMFPGFSILFSKRKLSIKCHQRLGKTLSARI
ncbi:protein of unknown function [Burkholderia multivorans]